MIETNAAAAPGTAQQEQVPDIGYSVAELEYLLSVAPGPKADRSAEVLNVAPVPSVDETILTGGAALLARGQLKFAEGGEFTLLDSALVVAYILTNAVRWTSISGAADDAADLGLFIESPHGGLLAQPRILGTWWFIILDPESVPSDVVARSAFGLAEQAEKSGVIVQMATLEESRAFSFRRDHDVYGYAFGETGSSEPEKLVENVGAAETLSDLVSFVTDFVKA
ncbi:hypothetical protein OH146_03895 [Salinibacterium sp. SYSU T00001]|uniref:hypothetical protein n=1 Tax=Homoserinimonas sedimenticola TaxID=2986805 RepID=UPI002235A811|nr:hypothetical protein [Salinibacterium sedimenticola]MCW4384913.1 hypothetical protein [Salinibacterium sedimenticola]